MQLLGYNIDNTGKTNHQLEHRLHQAEKQFWRNFKKLRGHTSDHNVKLEAWAATIHNNATYGCGGWRYNLDILREVRRWELHHLRKAFPMKPEENRHTDFETTA